MYVNGKMRPVETFQNNGWGRRMVRGELNYDIFDVL
jgi:hypothetical protein